MSALARLAELCDTHGWLISAVSKPGALVVIARSQSLEAVLTTPVDDDGIDAAAARALRVFEQGSRHVHDRLGAAIDLLIAAGEELVVAAREEHVDAAENHWDDGPLAEAIERWDRAIAYARRDQEGSVPCAEARERAEMQEVMTP